MVFSYAKVGKGGNDNNGQIDDEEGGGQTTIVGGALDCPSSSKRSGIGVKTIGVCCFFVGFLCGGLATTLWGGGSGLASFPKEVLGSGTTEEGEGPSSPERDDKSATSVEENAGDEALNIQMTLSDEFTVIEQISHDPSSFTQGLSYGYGSDGKLHIYETTGLYGKSKVRIIDPDTFAVETSVDTDGAYFGEGSTFYTDADGNGRLIQITWKEQTGFIFDSETLEQLSEFSYTTSAPGHEGWGITYDASKQEFIVSDGSAYLYFWDRDTLAEKRKVGVTRFDGSAQDQLNELEYMDGLVCCNIWYSDEIICVDPTSGRSVREYDMSSLWPADQRGAADVLNGIALGEDHVLVTGKLWDRMYKVVFPDWPALFASASEDESTIDIGVEQPTQDNSEERDDGAAVSYNFLRTYKGSQTMHLLLKDLLQSPSSSSSEQHDPSSGGDHSSMSGPRRALMHLSELMESDGQIYSSCHPLAHNLGRAAYKYFGSLDAAYDGMVGTDDAKYLRLCNAAYLHGVIEFHLRGVDDVNDLASAAHEIEENVCKELTNVSMGPWECRHGIGHGIIQRYRLDAEKGVIQKGIDACKQTKVSVDCENGLWMDHFAVSGNVMAMENRMMAVDVVVAGMEAALASSDENQPGEDYSLTAQERFRLPPLPPTLQICSLSTNLFGCFIYAATEYLLVNPGDYIGAVQYCTDPSAGIDQEKMGICVSGVSTQCAKEHMDDFSIVEEVCQSLDNESHGNKCFQAAVNYYHTSSGGQSLREAGSCDNLTRYKSLCH